MSNSFLKFFKPFFNNILFYSKIHAKNKIWTVGTICVVSLCGHCTYALKSVKNKIIKIDKKYKVNINEQTKFIIVDDNGEHYNLNNSFWHWKWDSIEDWHKLELNKEICIKYYGWRWPLFGVLPNVIMSNQDKILDTMTTSEYIIIESNRKQEKIKYFIKFHKI